MPDPSTRIAIARATRFALAPASGALVVGVAMAAALALASAPRAARAADCSVTSTGMVPLSDLGSGTHKGEPGGLYPGGVNAPPAAQRALALAAASRVVPRDAAGAPAGEGKVVLLSVGMSNTTQEFSTFVRQAAGNPRIRPSLTIVDGAQGGQTAADIRAPDARFWTVVDQRLGAAGATPAQVQAIWLKEANRQPGADGNPDTLPAARRLADDLESVVGVARARFPNLALIYLSSRIYAGYASSALNPEPYAYESGLAVRWLIQRQIDAVPGLAPADGAPVLLWGPYLWADGMTPRADGLTWACADLGADGTHPSDRGRAKVAGMLLDFFLTDETSADWFRVGDAPATPPNVPSAMPTAATPIAPGPSATPTLAATPTVRWRAFLPWAATAAVAGGHNSWLRVSGRIDADAR